MNVWNPPDPFNCDDPDAAAPVADPAAPLPF
jgi:hypothetical protein